jgi:uncharacterized membrane protein YdbT with pleckstrin-like domain
MYCKKCGSEIDDDSVFCQKCGTKVGGAQEEPAQYEEAEVEAEDYTPAREELQPAQAPPEPPGEEQDLWEGRRTIKRYLMWYILVISLLILGAVLVFMIPKELWKDSFLEKVGPVVRYLPFSAMLLVFLFLASKAWLFTHGVKYRLTTDRFFVTEGVFSRSIDELELIRVNDVVMDQGIWERMLGYGRVTIYSNDETTPQLTLYYVADPEFVKEQIRTAAAKKRKTGLYVERI